MKFAPLSASKEGSSGEFECEDDAIPFFDIEGT